MVCDNASGVTDRLVAATVQFRELTAGWVRESRPGIAVGIAEIEAVCAVLRHRVYDLFHFLVFFFFQAEDGIRDDLVTGVQTCALPILWSTEFFHLWMNSVLHIAKRGRAKFS